MRQHRLTLLDTLVDATSTLHRMWPKNDSSENQRNHCKLQLVLIKRALGDQSPDSPVQRSISLLEEALWIIDEDKAEQMPIALLTSWLRSAAHDFYTGNMPDASTITAFITQLETQLRETVEEIESTDPLEAVHQGTSGHHTISKKAEVRVPFERLDHLNGVISELTGSGEMLIEQTLGSQQPNVLHAGVQLRKSMRELESIAQLLRMVPMEDCFLKMRVVALNTARELGKRIEIHTEGGSTEIDKAISDSLLDAMTHLVRNAVDHGIESATQREILGKGPIGKITFRASQEAGQVIIHIEDDGSGVDLTRVEQKATALGWIVPGTERPTPQALTEFLFRPGFSTAQTVSDISGRGVGLDVVRSRIQDLRGNVIIDSLPGIGARFVLQLPLSLAIVDGTDVRIGNKQLLIPTHSIREAVSASATKIITIAQHTDRVQVRHETLPLIDTSWLTGVDTSEKNRERQVVVLVNSRAGTAALTVDELMGRRRVVVQGLPESCKKMKWISGFAMRGNRMASPIIDVNGLIDHQRSVATK